MLFFRKSHLYALYAVNENGLNISFNDLLAQTFSVLGILLKTVNFMVNLNIYKNIMLIFKKKN